MIGIRADANEVIASGHIMRCMAIAAQLVKMGIRVKFYISDDYPAGLLEHRGFEYFVLECDWRDKRSEVPHLRNILSEEKIDVLLVDSYEAGSEYLHELRQFVKLAYIDDLCRFPCDVDLLINYAVQDCERIYGGFQWKQPMPLMLTGLSYTPLREEFAAINEAAVKAADTLDASGAAAAINDSGASVTADALDNLDSSGSTAAVQDILITTGGSDNFGLTALIAREVLKTADSMPQISAADWKADVRLHILEGAFFKEDTKQKLSDLEREYPNNITIYRNLHNIENVLKGCQLAVSAGGTTLLEICSCRVCCVSFSISDNQKPLLKYLAKHHAVYAPASLPDMNEDNTKELAEAAAKAVFELAEDGDRRARIAKAAGCVVDGRGAQRIAQVLSRF